MSAQTVVLLIAFHNDYNQISKVQQCKALTNMCIPWDREDVKFCFIEPQSCWAVCDKHNVSGDPWSVEALEKNKWQYVNHN